ncbi:MAG TPA: demethoxyubiquinone hydroxylase family protein [Holophagaceae bacterium]|nr:demethoxyubiquinone hydroxylase family protein [Holophagaceae bacterium]
MTQIPDPELGQLVSILQRAYSGELAAALAYRGHWLSLKHDREIEEITQIEREEWHHRRRLGQMLSGLDSRPRPGLDAFQAFIGTVILIGCNMVGWFIPMYFAGRLESQNDREYEEAAALAEALDLLPLRDELKAFAQLERDHEAYFLRKVTGHPALPFWRRLFKWGPPT